MGEWNGDVGDAVVAWIWHSTGALPGPDTLVDTGLSLLIGGLMNFIQACLKNDRLFEHDIVPDDS